MQNPPPGPPQYAQQQYFAPPPPTRRGTPIWIPIVAVGCGCLVLLIPIMAAILFPVFGQAREKARQISCLSNVKQQALGIAIYAQDYDEVLPGRKGWMTNIEQYTKQATVFHCPSVSRANVSGSATAAFGYAYNADVAGKKLEQIEDPRQARNTYDSSNLNRDACDAFTSVVARHVGGASVSFMDGHAKWMRPPFIEIAAPAGSSQ